MSKLRIVLNQTKAIIEGQKRQYFPYELSAVCPNCNNLIVEDLNYYYLSYPVFGQVHEVHLYCKECDYESEPIKVKPSLTLVLQDD